ncbi:MAG: glycoside hydrolase family 95 protein, partial [Bacteroidaceae bacterium]|nr:glycoside hydrolase family 95 protein [Bacteroidaceae bacterium]
MKRRHTLIACLLCAIGLQAQTNYTQGLSVWFDRPTTLNGRCIWYGGRPDLWVGKNKPEWAGDGNYNADKEWESQSLPIGNGSIGANIMGSLEAERITLNEKTLWRGGPNTEKGAEYYWNVNKQSAHLLDDIRQAFLDGDDEKAAKLTRENFNSTASYEYYGEKPFRFGNFTTMGEIYIETGHNLIGLGDYKRVLSLDSALAVVQYNRNGVEFERKCFVSYPANVLVMKYSASKPGMQNLTFSYAPNPVSEGTLIHASYDQLLWKGKLD